jgi:hypothetical protein
LRTKAANAIKSPSAAPVLAWTDPGTALHPSSELPEPGVMFRFGLRLELAPGGGVASFGPGAPLVVPPAAPPLLLDELVVPGPLLPLLLLDVVAASPLLLPASSLLLPASPLLLLPPASTPSLVPESTSPLPASSAPMLLSGTSVLASISPVLLSGGGTVASTLPLLLPLSGVVMNASGISTVASGAGPTTAAWRSDSVGGSSVSNACS